MRLSRHVSYAIEPRIYVILRGGLGNQLHQIAAGVKFAESRGGKLVIFAHIVDTANNLNRRGFFREIDLANLFPQAVIRETNFIENILLRFLNLTDFKFISQSLISEVNFSDPQKRIFYLLKGYFQSFNFIPKKINYLVLRGSGYSETNQVSLHVRLTDFLTNDLNPLGNTYYTNALSRLTKKIPVKNLRCFSDDIESAQLVIPKGFEYEFPETRGGLSASELLSQLSRSHVLICSKSSLCWWAANAVSTSGGIVVSPWDGSTHNVEWLRAQI